MNETNDRQKAFEHYRLSIIDAKLSYTLFKTLYWSRAESIVGKEMQEKYFWVQTQHKGFFPLVENNAVIAFIIRVLHCFDYKKGDSRPLTLRDLDSKAYDTFVNDKDNNNIIKKLKDIRDKRIAHHDKTSEVNMELPSFVDLEAFFERVERFYDALDSKINDSTTLRHQDQDLKESIEHVLRNLYVGEKDRLLNNNMKYLWDENPRRISNIK